MELILDKPWEVYIKSIQLSDHGFERARERLDLKDKNTALGHLRAKLKHAKCIGEVVGEDGESSILFGYGRTAIFLTPDLKTIKTVFRRENVTFDPIKKKMIEIHEKEMRKLDRTIKARMRRLTLFKAKTDIEKAELNFRIVKSRSDHVKIECKNRINEIESYISELDSEIKQLQATKREIAKSMISLV